MPYVHPSPSRCLIFSIADLFLDIFRNKNAFLFEIFRKRNETLQEILWTNTDFLTIVNIDRRLRTFFQFPPDAFIHTDKDLNESKLYSLLIQNCNIPPHSNGWGLPPATDDRSLAACIERMRMYAFFLSGQSIFEKSKEADFEIILKNVGDDMDAIKMQGIETQWSSQKLKEFALHDPSLPMDREYDREGKLPKLVTNY